MDCYRETWCETSGVHALCVGLLILYYTLRCSPPSGCAMKQATLLTTDIGCGMNEGGWVPCYKVRIINVSFRTFTFFIGSWGCPFEFIRARSPKAEAFQCMTVQYCVEVETVCKSTWSGSDRHDSFCTVTFLKAGISVSIFSQAPKNEFMDKATVSIGKSLSLTLFCLTYKLVFPWIDFWGWIEHEPNISPWNIWITSVAR